MQANVLRPDEVTRLSDEAERAVGKLDIVVASAADSSSTVAATAAGFRLDTLFSRW